MSRQEESIKAKAAEIAGECIAVRLRMLTRAVTKIYNDALRPHGLTVSQMNILVTAFHLGQTKQQEIGRMLHLEKSTLSRDLARMHKQDWVSELPGDDGRATIISLTTAGKRLLEQAFPAWQQAQGEAKTLLGEKEANALGRTFLRAQAKK